MVPGVLIALIPAVPALFYMLVLAVIFALVDGFLHLTGANLAILGVIYLLSVFVDLFSGVIGAKYGGANARSLLAGLIGLVVGFFVLPPFGGLIGLFVGVLISELIQKRKDVMAFRAAFGSLAGAVTGILINTFLALVFLILFIVFIVG